MLIASWFGAGLLPYAPGTWGALAALPCGWVIAYVGGPAALIGGAAFVFALGCLVSGAAARALGQKDPGWVVIDEVAAIWALLGLLDFWVGPLDWRAYMAAFVLFRLFDILKPWPARLIERKVAGGAGIMLDDLVASVYALPPLALLISEGFIVVRP
ncbi:MAG: phosphatidylglycerophosphatase A [Alphaproteobacteria bacterium]